jgi:lysophospholipase L1-like esterase
MKPRRAGYRPSGCEALEDRAVPSGGLGTVGALGDSYTDEYRFYPPDRPSARNWVEILSATHRANFGPFSLKGRGEPRDQGFAFNWARSDATSSDMIANQLPGLSQQVARGQVRTAWIFSGGNDFLFYLRATLPSVLGGTTAGNAGLAPIVANVERNFTMAVDELLTANPNARLVVATVPDVNVLPIVRQFAAIPAAQPLLAAVGAGIDQYDAVIRATAASNPSRIALADVQGAAAPLFAAGSSASFGGTTVNLVTPGNHYRDFFVADGIHIGTIGQGIIADTFIQAVDTTFGAQIPPLSPTQIVHFARLVQTPRGQRLP